MKSIGILTFNTALNYGAVLQAYALKSVLDELGYETHIINYMTKDLDEAPKPFARFVSSKHSVTDFYKFIRSMLSLAGDTKRRKNFTIFRDKYLDESKECRTAQDIENLKYDIYIAGSDQIWNYKITGELYRRSTDEFDPVFFLYINTKAKKIIYAASSQDVPFPYDKEHELRNMLKQMDATVSVREQKLADYIEKIASYKYPVVLDPTLLVEKKYLDRIKIESTDVKPYILLYQIDSNPSTDISVKTLENRFHCDVYTMTVPRLGSTHGRKGIAGPEEFLSLLDNSVFLVTNSFHGVALAMQYEKQFYVYENNGVMSRIDDLLETVGLIDRKVKNVADIDIKNKIDYNPVREKLRLLRIKSMEFLLDSLAG